MKKLLYIYIFLSCLCSCEVDVTDEFRDQQNLFVVSGKVVSGEAPRINLSRTITMAEVDTLLYLNNAFLEIRKNDDPYVLSPEGEGFYRNESLIPEPGDELSLQVSGDELPEASLLTIVPDMPGVQEILFEVDEDFNYSLDVIFEDPASTNDYYSFYVLGWIKEIVHHHNWDTGQEWIDTTHVFLAHPLQIFDPVLEYTGGPRRFEYYDLSEPRGQYFHFSDQDINGQEHTLEVTGSLYHLYNDTIPEIYVHMVKRDAHYYNFVKSYINYDPYPEQDFIQPVPVYSNIEGGFGLLTVESRLVDTIDLSEWFSDPDFLAPMK